MKVTYYQILKVEQTATADEIKKGYRKQSAKYHPDRNKDPNATLFMTVVNEAYACLSDVDKRSAYDYTLRSKQTTQTSRPVHSNPYESAYNTANRWKEELDRQQQADFARRQREAFDRAYDRMKREEEEYLREEESRMWRDLQEIKEEAQRMKEDAERMSYGKKKEPSNYWDADATDEYISRWVDETTKPKQTASDKFFKFFGKK